MNPPQNAGQERLNSFSYHLKQATNHAAGYQPLMPAQRGIVTSAIRLFHAGCGWFERARAAQSAARRMRVRETISLGDKRFVSILQVDGQQFLVGSSAASVQLLAQLDSKPGGAVEGDVEVQERE